MRIVLIAISLLFISTVLNAQSGDKTIDMTKYIKSAQPFACFFGNYEVVKGKRDGSFWKFKLKGKGVLVNSNNISEKVSANPSIEYLTLYVGSDLIAPGSRIAVYCIKGTQEHGKPAFIDFYIPMVGAGS